jgi:hypothetical protein
VSCSGIGLDLESLEIGNIFNYFVLNCGILGHIESHLSSSAKVYYLLQYSQAFSLFAFACSFNAFMSIKFFVVVVCISVTICVGISPSPDNNIQSFVLSPVAK